MISAHMSILSTVLVSAPVKCRSVFTFCIRRPILALASCACMFAWLQDLLANAEFIRLADAIVEVGYIELLCFRSVV